MCPICRTCRHARGHTCGAGEEHIGRACAGVAAMQGGGGPGAGVQARDGAGGAHQPRGGAAGVRQPPFRPGRRRLPRAGAAPAVPAALYYCTYSRSVSQLAQSGQGLSLGGKLGT